MDHALPEQPQQLAEHLHALRENRRSLRVTKGKRRSLSPAQRERILAKTDGRCHICGGQIEDKWNADHVLAYSAGGKHIEENYLPAHGLCNSYKWDYSAEEFQWILKIGVWATSQIINRTQIGEEIIERFHKNEVRREKRRVSR